jgi:hypothetical protein
VTNKAIHGADSSIRIAPPTFDKFLHSCL